jgi:hypothetical protein
MNDRSKTWTTAEHFGVFVEFGKVIRASNIRPQDLIGKTLDDVFALVEARHGYIHRVSLAGWHSCADWPNDVCGACEESKNDPNARSAYSIFLP